MQTIKESDWKVFRRLQQTALERYCQAILNEAEQLLRTQSQHSHERYLALFRLLQKRDKEVANLFDDMRRSTALLAIAKLKRAGVLTAEEFALFSPETQFQIAVWLGEASH